MTTGFAWRTKDEPFVFSVHNRCDLEILSLVIDQREGEAALATLEVASADLPPLTQRHVYISYEGTLIFSGRLAGLPSKISNDLTSLEFTAEPVDADEALQELAFSLKQAPFWDEAFVDAQDVDSPSEWLEARNALYAWDRTSGEVCVSDLFQGRQTVDLSPAFFADSLKVCLAETPLAYISAHITVEWVQEATVEINLGTKIAAAFPGGIINTLTPDALEAAWPKTGDKFGQSGYRVVNSHLQEIAPPATGILNIYPTFTPELMTWDETRQQAAPRRLKRVWMSGVLAVEGRYRQKRRETLHFTLRQKTQFDGTLRPLPRTLNLRLQQVGLPSAAGSFFLTSRGRQALHHALLRARAYLAASARCLEVEVTLPMDAILDLSLDHSVRLVDPRLPGGEVTGKVIAYRLYQDGVKSHGWVRLAASVGTSLAPLPAATPLYYAEPAYGDTAIPAWHHTGMDLAYADYSGQRPREGVVDLDNLSLNDILRQVTVSNDAEWQIHRLQTHQYPVRQNLKSVLEENPTLILLDFLSLKTQSVAEHHIILNGLTPWSAPQQVNLGESRHEV